jgi:hypothetical protein
MAGLVWEIRENEGLISEQRRKKKKKKRSGMISDKKLYSVISGE